MKEAQNNPVIEVVNLERRIKFGNFLTILIIGSAVLNALLNAQNLFKDTVSIFYVNIGLIALFNCLVILEIIKNRFPKEIYGLRIDNWKKSVKTSILVSLLVIILITFLKWIFITYFDVFKDYPLFEFPDFPQQNKSIIIFILFIGYIFHAGMQELLFRGFIQGSLQHYLRGSFTKLRSSILATIIFAGAHLHLGLLFTAVIVPFSFLWGFLFSRFNSILPSFISHGIIGLYALFAINFEKIILSVYHQEFFDKIMNNITLFQNLCH